MANYVKYTWKTIPMKDVPEAINSYLTKHFNDDVVFGIVKKEENNAVFYVIDVDHNGIMHHIKFDHEGNFVDEKVEITGESSEEHFVTVGGGD